MGQQTPETLDFTPRRMRNSTVSTYDPSCKNGARNQCKQKKPYDLGIDISKEDTLHALNTPRGKDDAQNLARHIT